MPSVRRLTAILAADVAGYSRLMGADEEGTHERLKAHLRELVDPKIAEHRGRIVKNTGDGFLAEFPSIVDAVRCGVEIQRGMVERNSALPPDKHIEFRVGINLGDVIVEEHDIFGDGVNVAARLEALAEPSGICVSRVVRDQIRDKLPYPLDDMGEQQVKNIARPVRVYRVRDASAKSPAALASPALSLPDKASIAVLPFANMSGDPEQEYFADGMVEEIITALSRIRWLFVIARNSSLTYKGQSFDVKQVGRELGVHYILEGSVRKAGLRIRITGQLIDAVTGTHLWFERFDGSLEDVFDLQDQVAISVAGIIEPALQAAEIRRSAERPTSDLTAYDLYLRALAHSQSQEKDRLVQAVGSLNHAIERDPQYGPALALSAFCQAQIINNGWFEDRETTRRTGLDLARRAIRVGGDDPGVLAYAAFTLGFFGEDIDAALALIDHAVALNQSFAFGWERSAMLRLFAGQPDIAIEHLERSWRLSPRDRMKPRSLTAIGIAMFFQKRFEDAGAKLVLSLEELPSWTTTYRFLASCYAHMGRLDEAQEIVKRLRIITSVVVPTVTNFRKAENLELFLSGLRLAAGEAK
jgi:TolB-like protein/class 3 adenylate cyclase